MGPEPEIWISPTGRTSCRMFLQRVVWWLCALHSRQWDVAGPRCGGPAWNHRPQHLHQHRAARRRRVSGYQRYRDTRGFRNRLRQLGAVNQTAQAIEGAWPDIGQQIANNLNYPTSTSATPTVNAEDPFGAVPAASSRQPHHLTRLTTSMIRVEKTLCHMNGTSVSNSCSIKPLR